VSLLDNAAAYKYINDQSLFYANQGYTMNEINEAFDVPEESPVKILLRLF